MNTFTFSTPLLRCITVSACSLLLWQNVSANEKPEIPTVSEISAFQTPTINSGGINYFCSGSALLLTCSIAETYQWYKDGQPISGATAQTFNATENGYYKVAVTHGEGPDGISAELFVRQGNHWIGAAGDGNWYTPSNWSCGAVPAANDHVEIAETNTFPILSDGSTFTVYSLALTDDALLTVASGSTLVVTDVIEIAESASLVLRDEASLVQTNDVDNVGNITAQKRTAPMKRYDFTYWSSPVSGQTLFDLSPLTMADKYYSYSPTIGNWVSHLGGTQIMEQGKGYIVRAPQSYSTTLAANYDTQFVGKANNGTIGTPIVVGTSDMNLIGNPYPSAIDMDAFLMHPNNLEILDGTVYLWTHNSAPALIPGDNTYNYTSNDYAAYNLLGGIGTSTSGNNEKPTGKVASGQSFFIKGLDNGQAVFNNNMRVIGANDQFFRSNEQDKNRLWLNLNNNQGAFKQTLLGYIEGATDGIDRNYDGIPFNANAYVDFYSLVNDKQLAIQGRGLPFDQQAVIPLGYSTTVPGMFTISIDRLEGLFENQDIFLHDYELDITYDLKELTTYMFATSMGTFNSRFELRFVDPTLATETFGNMEAVASGSQFQLRTTSPMESISISDLSGRIVYDHDRVDASQTTIDGIRQQHTVYFIKVKLTNGKTFVKKML